MCNEDWSMTSHDALLALGSYIFVKPARHFYSRGHSSYRSNSPVKHRYSLGTVQAVYSQ